MYWSFSGLIQQVDRMMYAAGAMALFVVLYLWSVLDSAASHVSEIVVQTPAKPLFSIAGHSIYQLSDGVLAFVQDGVMQYLFSSQEVMWLRLLSLVSECLLWAVVIIAVIALKDAASRRYGFVISILALQLLTSPLCDFSAHVSLNPWIAVCHIALLFVGAYWATRQYRQASSQHSALIAYASQTGSAKRLAEQLYQSAQTMTDLRCVSELTAQQLKHYRKVFFVVSTHGNGEAPDSAYRLIKDLQHSQSAALDTQFSVLALGDRTYKTFCAFGYQLSDLLNEKGFKRLLPTQEVDRMDLRSVDSWWSQVCDLLGLQQQKVELEYDEFTVIENECLNPQQPERLAHRICLYRPNASYQAGDLLAVQPMVKGEAQDERLYSIASCRNDYVELLVRRHIREDGSIGVGSGYLTDLEPNATIKASLREHISFRLVGDVPLIMIGAGTGLAPLISFLKQKQAWQSETQNWLFFGERYHDQDDYFAEDLYDLKANGTLTRMDCAWSKTDGLYVPALIEQHADDIRQWLELGAHIYLCGSRFGFGESVMVVLESILSEEQLRKQLHTDLY